MPEIYDASAPDPTERDLGTLFALALTDEPESRVTAASVLHEVRQARASGGFAEWLRTAGWKWGGGLIATAALVGAVVVLPPIMGGSGDDSMTMADAGAAYSSADDSDTGAVADQDEAAEDSAADSAMAGMAAKEAPSPQADKAADDSGEPTSEIRAADSAADGSVAAVPPPLTEAEWTAAVSALPAGSTGHRWDDRLREVGLPAAGPLRSDMIGLGGADQYLIATVGPDTGPGHDYPGDSDPATVGDLAERYRHAGMIVVQSADGADRVVVAATEQALQLVTRADLTRIAAAVLGAS